MPKFRILIVEDEAILAMDFTRQLSELGYQPIGHASDGEQALGMAEPLRPDLVLMDIGLGGRLDGIATAQRLFDQFFIPVVFYMAFLDEALIERAKLVQPYGYINKPFRPNELRLVIDLALSKHRTESEMRRVHKEQAAILRSAMDGYCLLDMQARILEVNGALARINGYSQEELIGMSIGDLEANESAAEIIENIQQMSRRGSARFVRQHRHKDGRLIEVEVSLSYLPVSGGRLFCFLRDITEQRQAEEALRKREAHYRLLVETAKEGVWTMDSEHRTTFVNQAMSEMLGYAPKEMIGKRVEEFFYPEDMPIHEERMRKRHAGQDEIYERRFRRRNGEPLWTLVSAKALQDEQGGFAGSFAMFSDITERKQAEAALRQSQAVLHSIFRSAPIGIGLVKNRILAWTNERLSFLTGYTAEEMNGQSARLLYPTDEEFERVGRVKYELIRQQGTGSVESQWRHKSGHRIEVLLSSTPMDPSDLSQGVTFTALDITERKKSEDRVRKLSTAVEQSPVSIMITGSTGMIEYVNPKFTQLTGYTLEEVPGAKPHLLQGSQMSVEQYQKLWETITQGGEWHGEFPSQRKNGEGYWERAAISPIFDSHGNITHFLAIEEDITEQKRLEAQLLQAQKMESVGQLAGGIAHDFNNILGAIMMHLSLLKEAQDLNPTSRELLNELLLEAQRAANLTRQLLVFSRRNVMEIKWLDLNELVQNLLTMLGRLIGEHILVRFDRREGLPALEADASMLEQVIMNLAVNARDAMPHGGELTISIDLTQADEARVQGRTEVQPGQFLCLKVSDTGCGMDAATQQRVFEPFFTTKESGKGTGLGLATVHGIATQHKGWVEVESEVGKGSTFMVFLPAAKQRMPKPLPAGPRLRFARGAGTILLVEDEANLRKVVAQGLRMLGYQVIEAGNGREAMEQWKEHRSRIDLLFSDMVMPGGMTGLDLAEQLKAAKPELKIILSSGYNTEQAGQRRPAGDDITYLPKPYQMNDLSKAVRDCLDRPR